MIKKFKRDEFHSYDRHDWTEDLIDFTVIKLLSKIKYSSAPNEYKEALEHYIDGDIGIKWNKGELWYCLLVKTESEVEKEV